MELLNVLEFLSTFPGECWLVPPIIIVGAITAIAIARRASLLATWERIAGRLGLTLDRTNLFNSPVIHGDYRGRAARMLIVSRRDTPFRRDQTRIEVLVSNPERIRLRFWKQDALDTLLKAAGMTDVQIGDPAFDRHFFIRCDQPDAARTILANEALRGDLLRTELYEVDVTSSRLTCNIRRVERDPAHAELLLGALAALADRIDGLKIEHKPEIIQT